MKPRGYDPAADSAILVGTGAVYSVGAPEDAVQVVKGVLLVPDPEQRHGWRERYIYGEPKPGAERRSIGFRKP